MNWTSKKGISAAGAASQNGKRDTYNAIQAATMSFPLSEVTSGENLKQGRRLLDIIVPIYRNAALTKRCVDSLLSNLEEIDFLEPRVLLINDSPDDQEVEELLVRYDSTYSSHVRVLRNTSNLGFVRTVNRGLKVSVKEGRNVLLVNSDTETFPKTLKNLAEALTFDPQIGFISPRSNNASICTLPHSSGGDLPKAADAFARWQIVARTLPKVHFVPTAVGFYMMVRHDVIANFGLLREEFGLGYEEENDLVMRANKVGIRAAVANHAFAYHAGSASFDLQDIDLDDQRAKNLQRIASLHPEFLPLVYRYVEGAHFRAERLMSGLVRNSSNQLRVAVDLSQLGCYSNGTSEFSVAVIQELAKVWRKDMQITAVCDKHVFEFHKLDKVEGVARAGALESDGFAVAVRLAQPFDLHHLNVMEATAPINIYAMLDTIAEDCGYLSAKQRLTELWGHAARHSNGLIFISRFGELTFCNRYPAASANNRFARLLPTRLSSYKVDVGESGREYVLILGNKFLHKDGERTGRLLSRAYPSVAFRVLGERTEDRGNVRMIASGNMSEREMEQLYLRASVIVLPSHVEGFGLGIVRGIAAGKPIVARRIDTTLEILETYGRVSGVFLFDDNSEMAEQLRRAMGADRSSAEDSNCCDWSEWAAGLGRFILDRTEDGDIFERLRDRIEAGDLLRKSAQAVSARAGSANEAGARGVTDGADAKQSDWDRKDAGGTTGLLELEGSEFVEGAYRAILGRGADEAGRAHYIAELARGGKKVQVLKEIARSDEAKARGVTARRILAQLESENGMKGGTVRRVVSMLARPFDKEGGRRGG